MKIRWLTAPQVTTDFTSYKLEMAISFQIKILQIVMDMSGEYLDFEWF